METWEGHCDQLLEAPHFLPRAIYRKYMARGKITFILQATHDMTEELTSSLWEGHPLHLKVQIQE